jgi:hypothetical protein
MSAEHLLDLSNVRDERPPTRLAAIVRRRPPVAFARRFRERSETA